MGKIYSFLLFIFFLLQYNCPGTEDFNVIREITGPYQTNCYLIYGKNSREAAIIDPGWKIDTITAFIKNNNLDLKYIFITHGHIDHYYYVPELKEQFPKVRWGINKDDYEKIILDPDWQVKAYGQERVDRKRKNHDESIYLDFDPESLGKPDIFIRGDQTFKIGLFKIKTIHTPGHSPGGICFSAGNILFSGDMLFYRSVGILDKLTSNTEDFIRSVRRLYSMFPDSTIVYPGHNGYTDIGSEKKENKRIPLAGGLSVW
jgi:hydroxyacylglutathione hydrolase